MFLLAAGLGERLRPLTEYRPKPLVPVANRPLIEYTINFLKSHNYRDLVINLHHLPGQIQETLGDGTALDVRIEYSLEPEILGTAGGLKKAEALLGKETFLAINSDILLRLDLGAALRFHRERGALATLLIRKYSETPRQPDLAVDASGRIRRFLSHGAEPDEPGLTNALFTGVTFMEPEMLKEFPPRRYCSISEEVYPRLVQGEADIYGWWTEGDWRDVGTPAAYLRANWEVLGGKYSPRAGTEEPLQSGRPIQEVRHPRGAEIPAVEIKEPVLIGNACRIEPGSRLGPNVVIGPGGRVGRNVRLSQSLLWENVEVGDGCTARRVIIGPGVQVPKDAKLQSEMLVTRNLELRGFPLEPTDKV
ncbi:MAG: sugar phosphate nucleotidyltransferase [Nitrospinota bacterium]